MRLIIFLAVCIAAISGASQSIKKDVSQRIIGGSLTTINQYPFMAVIMFTMDGVIYAQYCGGSILNNRSILTAPNCLQGWGVANTRFRVGSSWVNSGGVVHTLSYRVTHGLYNPFTLDYAITILRSANTIIFNNAVAPVSIAGPTYNVADNSVVWTAGWGVQSYGGPPSEQLRHVQIWTINQTVCAQRYGYINRNVTANMLCSGWLDVGGRDHCTSDYGGPLLHNGVAIGVSLFGDCGSSYYPGVNLRVSNVSSWIQFNA